MQKKLSDVADILRSKNAGPYTLTIDFLFSDKTVYDKVKAADALDSAEIAKMYKVAPESVKVYYYDMAHGIKVTIPRRIPSGCGRDSDVYGAQQHMLLMNLTVDI